MIKCNSKFAYCDKCVADMDAQQSLGGTICCDTAEDLEYNKENILTHCEYAELIKDNKPSIKLENIFLFDVAGGCNGGLIIANDLDDVWEKLAADRDCPVKDFKKMACIAPITTLDLTRNIHNLY